jgi:hypothetical protein
MSNQKYKGLSQVPKSALQLRRRLTTNLPKNIIPQHVNDRLNKKKCEYMNKLYDVLTPDELEFFHEYLADYDLYSTILLDRHGDWNDICFATSEALYDILTDSHGTNINIALCYDRTRDPVRFHRPTNKSTTLTKSKLADLRTALLDNSLVTRFDTEGDESHSFILYPIGNGEILLIQSAGGIMRANMRILTIDDFISGITLMCEETNTTVATGATVAPVAPIARVALDLFGYVMKENKLFMLGYVSDKKRHVNKDTLINYIDNLSDANIELLYKAFSQYHKGMNQYPAWDINTDNEFVFNESIDSKRPYYYVDAVTSEWRCVDKAIDIPISMLAIVLRDQSPIC